MSPTVKYNTICQGRRHRGVSTGTYLQAVTIVDCQQELDEKMVAY